jgi:hypothetical protein
MVNFMHFFLLEATNDAFIDLPFLLPLMHMKL